MTTLTLTFNGPANQARQALGGSKAALQPGGALPTRQCRVERQHNARLGRKAGQGRAQVAGTDVVLAHDGFASVHLHAGTGRQQGRAEQGMAKAGRQATGL